MSVRAPASRCACALAPCAVWGNSIVQDSPGDKISRAALTAPVRPSEGGSERENNFCSRETMELPMSMSLDQLTQHREKEAVLGWPAASAPPPPPHGRNKYVAAANQRFSDTAFAGRSFTLDDDGLVEFQCSARLGVRSEGSSGMDDRDKRIYNSLGDTSGPKGKVRVELSSVLCVQNCRDR